MPFGSHPSRGFKGGFKETTWWDNRHQCLSAVTPLGAAWRGDWVKEGLSEVTNAFRQSPLSGRAPNEAVSIV